MNQNSYENLQASQITKDRNSNSTNASEDFYDSEQRISYFDELSENLKDLNIQCFSQEVIQTQLSPKLHKKIMYWLFAICWDRNIKLDSLWLTLMIYYRYKAKKLIKKTEIQKTLCSCLLIGCKMVNPQLISMKMIIEITCNKFTSKQISEVEGQILKTLDYNIIQDNFLTEISFSKTLSQKQCKQFFCLCEFMMTLNSDIFWKKKVSENIIMLLLGRDSYEIDQLKVQLSTHFKSKLGQLVIRKYSSIIDTQDLIKKFIKN